MNAKKVFWLCLGALLAGGLSLAAPAADEVSSVWTADPPKIDGQLDDWANIAWSREKSLGVEYAFRNNDQNLYLALVFKNPKFLSTISQTGIVLYFSPEGKKDKSRGIRFIQRTVTAEELIAVMEKDGKTLTDERKQQLRSKSNYILYDSSMVDDEDKVLGPAVGSGDSLPPVFRLGRSGPDTVYEFRVPLHKSGEHPGGMGVLPGQSLKAGFYWGGMTKEMREAQISRLSSQGVKAEQGGKDFGGESTDGYSESSPRGTSLEAVLRGPKRHGFWTDVMLATAEVK